MNRLCIIPTELLPLLYDDDYLYWKPNLEDYLLEVNKIMKQIISNQSDYFELIKKSKGLTRNHAVVKIFILLIFYYV